MNNVKKIVKDNKYTIIALIVFVLFVVLGFALYRFLFPTIGSPVYGNRLDGIEEVEIVADQMTEIEDKIKEKEFVTKVSSYMKGRIYNVVIEVADGTSVADAKTLPAITSESLREDQREYFDIQVFITNENEEATGYPIIGYLNKESSAFSYSEND